MTESNFHYQKVQEKRMTHYYKFYGNCMTASGPDLTQKEQRSGLFMVTFLDFWLKENPLTDTFGNNETFVTDKIRYQEFSQIKDYQLL